MGIQLIPELIVIASTVVENPSVSPIWLASSIFQELDAPVIWGVQALAA